MENTEAWVVASKEIGLEINDKTKYMVMSRDQNAGQSHNIKTDSSMGVGSGPGEVKIFSRVKLPPPLFWSRDLPPLPRWAGSLKKRAGSLNSMFERWR